MSIQEYGLKLQRYYRRTAASVVFRKSFAIRPSRPLISFTFDDFPRSAFLAGGSILNRFGLAGTYYASLGLAGKDSPGGPIFRLEDLIPLVQQGHELGCHTFSHLDSWRTDGPTFENSVLENHKALQAVFPGAKFESFSYPISLPRVMSKARVAPYFLSCRGGGQTFNVGRTDLNQLSAYFLEKSRDNIQAVKDLIDANRKACGWLIFATHDICENPSPFGCTPEFLEEIVRYAADSGAQILPVIQAMEALGAPGCDRARQNRRPNASVVRYVTRTSQAKPLVSILIPAFNAEEWISDTLRSAIGQTWERKEIIVVDDGSSDQTVAIARQFESKNVRVIEQKNQGAAAARNTAYSLSQGDYIQWLDADDLLAPDKVTRQMGVAEQLATKRTLLSSEFGRFLYRWQGAEFVASALWENLSPAEWLRRKMEHNLWMQTATWLVSRELSEDSGPWDTRMLSDDDGEYFCRVLLKSDGVRFVPDAKMYYRGFRFNSLAYVGKSDRKREALWLSMQLHVAYLRSLDDSRQSREACLTYLQRNLIHFFPERTDILQQAEQLAETLGGHLRTPHLSRKYSWLIKTFGWPTAKETAMRMRKVRWSLAMSVDKMRFHLESRDPEVADPEPEPSLTFKKGPK